MRPFRFISVLLVAALTAACAVPRGEGVTIAINAPFVQEECFGGVWNFDRFSENGAGRTWDVRIDNPARLSAPMLGDGEGVLSEPHLFSIGWKPENFVSQSKSDLCWAAATSMGFRHSGFKYSEAEFLTIIREICKLPRGRSATANQILFTIYARHTNSHVWVSDLSNERPSFKAELERQLVDRLLRDALNVPQARLGAPLMPGMMPIPGVQHMPLAPTPTQFDALRWKRPLAGGGEYQGGVFRVSTPLELVEWLNNRKPVIAGLEDRGRHHAVLVIGALARPGGIIQRDGSVQLIAFLPPRLESVRIVDPAGSGVPQDIGGDEFIRSVRFAYALDP